MKSTWPRTVTQAVRAVRAVATALTPPPPPAHKCDATGWYCDCVRRGAVNTRAADQSAWLGDTRNWLSRRGR